MTDKLRTNTLSKCSNPDCSITQDWLTEEFVGYGCGDPCSFMMGKSGNGAPSIPTQEWRKGFMAGMVFAKTGAFEV